MAEPYKYKYGGAAHPNEVQARLYEDIGIRLTDDQRAVYEQKLAERTAWEEARRADIAAAQNRLNRYEVDMVNPNDAWNDYASTFVPIHVYDSESGRELGDYWFPPDAMDDIYSTIHSNGGNINHLGGNHLSLDVEGYGGEITQSLEDSWWDIHDTFIDTVTAQNSSNNSALSQAQRNIDDASAAVDTVIGASEAEVEAARDLFQSSAKRRGQTLSALFG